MLVTYHAKNIQFQSSNYKKFKLQIGWFVYGFGFFPRQCRLQVANQSPCYCIGALASIL